MSRIKRFLCWIGWHSWSYEPVFHDGASWHSRCRWCRGVGLVDSGGNLFAVKRKEADDAGR